MKYGPVTLGQIEAVINQLGGLEVWQSLLRGEKTIVLRDSVSPFFDKHGRRIPEGTIGNVCDADKEYRLIQPSLDETSIANRILRLHKYMSVNTGITPRQLKERAEHLIEIIRKDSRIANITQGVCLPIILPKLVEDDLGAEMERYLDGLTIDLGFCNYCEEDLTGKIRIAEESRYGKIIEQMKKGPVVAIYFPNPLQGFSIKASRKQMRRLPGGFILSGLDVLIAAMMYPDVLARDKRTPILNLAALQWNLNQESFLINRGVVHSALEFLATARIFGAKEDTSSGLLFTI